MEEDVDDSADTTTPNALTASRNSAKIDGWLDCCMHNRLGSRLICELTCLKVALKAYNLVTRTVANWV